MQIRAGAQDWCDLIWLIDADDPSAVQVKPILNRFGKVVEALGGTAEQAAAAVAPHQPDGVATFYDTSMEHVAEIAAALKLPFHSPQTARCLEDKLHQRKAFAAAGLPTPGVVEIPAATDATAVIGLTGSITFPAVLKPRRASGSWHTLRVDSAGELRRVWEELTAEGPEELVVEEYLPDGPRMPGGFEADYVSVETVVCGGEMSHLAITGRFPLAAPFRETGFFIPATVPLQECEELLVVAGEALRALGVTTGAAHTEIKLTPQGPRVIEVNGRIGGGVPDMLRLSAGLDIVRLAMEAALGRTVHVSRLPATSGVAYRFFYQPPPTAHRLVSIDGLDRLKRLPGVRSVYLHHLPGTELDARHGTRTYLFDVVGSAADHAGVVAVYDFLRREIEARYE